VKQYVQAAEKNLIGVSVPDTKEDRRDVAGTIRPYNCSASRDFLAV
jgi:hypothetical protein